MNNLLIFLIILSFCITGCIKTRYESYTFKPKTEFFLTKEYSEADLKIRPEFYVFNTEKKKGLLNSYYLYSPPVTFLISVFNSSENTQRIVTKINFASVKFLVNGKPIEDIRANDVKNWNKSESRKDIYCLQSNLDLDWKTVKTIDIKIKLDIELEEGGQFFSRKIENEFEFEPKHIIRDSNFLNDFLSQ